MIEFFFIIIFQYLYLLYFFKTLDKVLFLIFQNQDIYKRIEKNIIIVFSKFNLIEQTLI